MNTTTLTPCPTCDLQPKHGYTRTGHQLYCPCCDLEASAPTENDAIQEWEVTAQEDAQ